MTRLLPEVAHRTDRGSVRERNEDSVSTRSSPPLLVVADGMGGHRGGDVASAVAVDQVVTTLVSRWMDSPEEALRAGDEALGEAHRAVRRRGQEDRYLLGMGTTLTFLLLDLDGHSWYVGHVGDSRAYLIRDHRLERLTRDDSLVQSRIDAGELAPEEAWGHPQSHILTQAVGLDTPPSPRSYQGPLQPDDLFLLCTDGLTDMLRESRIQDIVDDAASMEAVADHLVAEALAAGGKDNVTVALTRIGRR